MNIEYDQDADAMYIRLRKAEVADTKKIDDNTIIDLDKDGKVIGVELLFVKENNPELLNEFQEKKLVTA